MEAVDPYVEFNIRPLVVENSIGNLSKLEKKARFIHGKVEGEGDYLQFLSYLRESNPSSYKNLSKMIKIAYRKKLKESKYS